ncbi:MAG: nitrite/sulfite reductase [Dehalococcoidia bacterium]|nr:nitrite/sulfite reductase [Dehalococcoidia bacterium]
MVNTPVDNQKIKRVIPMIPHLPEEVDHFEKETQRFLDGQADATAFRGFRLRQGVYGQRQPGFQMMRIKIPLGRLSPDMLDTIGTIAERFTETARGHVTTRECVQLHFMKLEHAAEAMRMLGEVGIGSREACGNTVRNATGCALEGVCPTEAFDVSPYAAAFVRFMVRHPVTQNMPRKFKSAFSGCESDCAMTPMHDIGFVARMRDGKKGFKLVVGGGLSVFPRMASTLYEFCPVEDFIRVSEAIVRVYNVSDELRKNRMKARIKVLVERVGIDEFRRMIEKELEGDWAKGPDGKLKQFDLEELGELDNEEEFIEPGVPVAAAKPAPKNDPAFNEWKMTNVMPQKQKGYVLATIKLKVGNLTSEQFHALAKVVRDYVGTGAIVRTTFRQNLVIRWVREEQLYNLYQALKPLELVESGANEINDVTSCPGTESCSLGITASTMMGAYLTDYLKNLRLTDPLVRQVRINISGCPDGCGQHHLGNLGFQGAAMKNESGQIPSYEVYVGGSQVNTATNQIRVGHRLKQKVPSKRVPEAIKTTMEHYMAERKQDEVFNDWVDRVGKDYFETLFAPLAEVPKLSRQTIDFYMDYGRSVLYKVQRGEGECAI